MPIAVNPNVHISGDLYVTLDNEEVLVKGTTAAGQPLTDAPVVIGAEEPGGNIVELQATAAGELFVDIAELPTEAALDDATGNPTTTLIGACQMGWDAVGVHWERIQVIAGAMVVDTELPAAAALSDAFANPTAPAVGAFLMGFDGTDWERVRVTNTGQLHTDIQDRAARDLGKVDIAVFDTAITAADATATPTSSPPVVGINMVYNGATWDMLREGALPGSVIADTELPAAGALADNMANPTTPLIGACNMVYDGAQWDRVTLVTITDAFANPATTGTAAFLMGWNNAATDWDRLITVEAGDAQTTGLLAAGLYIYNGASHDMVREGFPAGSISVDPYYEPTRAIGTSAANTLQTVSTAVEPCKVLFVTVKWSAAVTKDVTVTLNAGAGAAYDTLLQTISFANETDGVWFPDSDVILKNDDQLDVLAPAGGAGITSAIQIYTQPVRP